MKCIDKIKKYIKYCIPYYRLMRFNNSGVILLPLFPSWSSIILTSNTFLQTVTYMILFFFGAVTMRSAGCIINDIFDRDIDIKVKRTINRPLASKELTVKQSLKLLIFLLITGFIILLFTNIITIIMGFILMIMIAIYPLTKRFFIWPQLILGLTFNFGVLMGCTVITGSISLNILLLYIGCVFWTMGYDTIYASQDIKDDIKIGIKSTAISFGSNIRVSIKRIYLIAITMWMCAAILSSLNYLFYLIFSLVVGILYYQYKKTDFDNPVKCMYMFKLNLYIGFFLFLAIFFGKYY